jgi:protein TonB
MKALFVVPALLCGAVFLTAGSAIAASPPPDSPPRLDTSGVNMQPNYPEGSTASGSPEVLAAVRDNGTVSKVAIAKSSGSSALDSAAANAVMHWKFIPAMDHGEPVSGKAIVQVVFQAPDNQ